MFKADPQRLQNKIGERLERSDMQLLRSILVFLDTRSWAINSKSSEHDSDSEYSQDYGNMEHIITAADYTVSLFRPPLEAKGASISSFNDELEEIVSFGRKYINIEQEDYKKIWYKLHTTFESKKWPSVLLRNLLFSLPFTTAAVESVFSKLKIIKTELRCSLQTSTLDDLLEVNLESPTIKNFSSASAVELWWHDRMRWPSHSSKTSAESSGAAAVLLSSESGSMG